MGVGFLSRDAAGDIVNPQKIASKPILRLPPAPKLQGTPKKQKTLPKHGNGQPEAMQEVVAVADHQKDSKVADSAAGVSSSPENGTKPQAAKPLLATDRSAEVSSSIPAEFFFS